MAVKYKMNKDTNNNNNNNNNNKNLNQELILLQVLFGNLK